MIYFIFSIAEIKEGLVRQKQEYNVKEDCENENPESRGIGLIVAAEDRPEHSDIDAETVMGTFQQKISNLLLYVMIVLIAKIYWHL